MSVYEDLKVELCDSWGSDENIAHAAWASTYDIEKAITKEKSPADIKRVVTDIVRNKHGTPKERVFFEFYIECPIFVERQFDKYRLTVQYQDFQIDYLVATPEHRVNITQNELSGRYRTFPERAYRCPPDVAAITEKAGVKHYKADGTPVSVAYRFDDLVDEQYEKYRYWIEALKNSEKEGKITNAEYKRAREVLRGVLGTAFITSMRVITNLHEFEHIINQRLSPHAQLESRIIAYRMLMAVEKSGVAREAIQTMIQANGWSAWLEEVKGALEKDNA